MLAMLLETILVILKVSCFELVNAMFYSGPYGEQDDEQVFVQKVVSETDKLFVRYASTGKR
jgi:hypothetical protein